MISTRDREHKLVSILVGTFFPDYWDQLDGVISFKVNLSST